MRDGNLVAIDATTGAWSYTLDNSRAATQALNAGDPVSDMLTVTSLDGTATHTITVAITGANDAPSAPTLASGGTPASARAAARCASRWREPRAMPISPAARWHRIRPQRLPMARP